MKKIIYLYLKQVAISIVALFFVISSGTIQAEEYQDWISSLSCNNYGGGGGRAGTTITKLPWYIERMHEEATLTRLPEFIGCPINIAYPRKLSNLSSIWIDYVNHVPVDDSDAMIVQACVRKYSSQITVCSDEKKLRIAAGHNSIMLSSNDLTNITSSGDIHYLFLRFNEQKNNNFTNLIGFYITWDIPD